MKRGKKQDPVARQDKVLGEEYVAKLNSAGPEELRQMMTEAASQLNQQKDLRKADPDLIRLKEQLATASAGYREAIKRLDLATRRIQQRMEEKGMDTGVEREDPKAAKVTPEMVARLGGEKPLSPNSPEARAKVVHDMDLPDAAKPGGLSAHLKAN